MAVSVKMFKARYPVFDGVAAAAVQFALDDAAEQVTAWLEKDRDRGQMLYAAHLLVEEDQTNNGAATTVAREVLSESKKLGDATEARTYSSQSGGGGGTDKGSLGSTPYGKRFLALQRQNVSGPLVVF